MQGNQWVFVDWVSIAQSGLLPTGKTHQTTLEEGKTGSGEEVGEGKEVLTLWLG